MTTSLVLTLIGRDRPGLAAALAATVASHGGNWLESQMARLAGQFAGILRVAVPRDRAEALTAALARLSEGGLTLTVVPGEDEPASGAPGLLLTVALTGQDHPGIVREITQRLQSHSINIEALRTGIVSAPFSGEALFLAELTVLLPQGMASDAISKALEPLANELMVDINVANAASD
jgi:glycine cleavage system regulatory protein